MFSTASRALTELTDSQHLALQALLAGATQAEAAAAARADERSLRRWLHDPVFRSALHQARCDAWNTVTARLQRAALKAAATLEALLDADHPYARALAARAILQYALRALDADDLTTRAVQLEADIEAHLAAQSHSAPPAGPGGPGAPPAPAGARDLEPGTSRQHPYAASCLSGPSGEPVRSDGRRQQVRPRGPGSLPPPPPPLPILLPALRLRAAGRRAAAHLFGLARTLLARLTAGPALPPTPAA